MKTKTSKSLLLPEEQDTLRNLVWAEAVAKVDINDERSEWLESILSDLLEDANLTPDVIINTLKFKIVETIYAKYTNMAEEQLKKVLNDFEGKKSGVVRSKYIMRVQKAIEVKSEKPASNL